jgi:hypothetical protein
VEDNGADAPDDSDGRVRGVRTSATSTSPTGTTATIRQTRTRTRGADDAPGHVRGNGLDDLAMSVGN